MVYVKWTFWGLFWLIVLSFFHYTLPQRDVVRITDTYEKRIDFGENSIFWSAPDSGNATGTANRDVFFIQTKLTGGDVMVYRNEDTGWGWPPYFKFDTANLQAEAADLKSLQTDPQWVVLRHYGWRNEFLSIYPNAVSVRPISGPDVPIGWPWLNTVILTLFFAFCYAIWARWRKFRAARIDPIIEDAGDAWDDTGEAIRQRRGRVSRWFGSWRSK